MENNPPRLEDTDPALAEHFRLIANGIHPHIKSIDLTEGRVRITPKPYTAPTHTGRNDPCPCGSGRKFKKCCSG